MGITHSLSSHTPIPLLASPFKGEARRRRPEPL